MHRVGERAVGLHRDVRTLPTEACREAVGSPSGVVFIGYSWD